MKRGTTLFLKVTLVLVGIPILAACIFGLPVMANEAAKYNQVIVYSPAIIGIYAGVIPFYVALHQTYKLLTTLTTIMPFQNYP